MDNRQICERSARYRRRAEDVRSLAKRLQYNEARLNMLALAADYDDMAEWLDRLAARGAEAEAEADLAATELSHLP